MKRKRVLMAFFSETYRKGLWRRFDVVIEAMTAIGMKVDIVSYKFQGQRPPFCFENGAWYMRPPRIIRLFDLVIGQLSLSLLLLVLVKRLSPNAVVVNNAMTPLFVLRIFKPLIGNPILVYDMNDLIQRLRYYGKWVHLIARLKIFLNEVFIPRICDKILTVTQFGRRYLLGLGHSPDKVFVLEELVQAECFENRIVTREKLGFSETDKIVLWQGGIREYQKVAIKTMIEGVGKSGIADVRVVILGRCEDKDLADFTTLSYKHGVRITFAGFVNNVPEYLSVADVGVQALPKALFCRFITGIKLAEYVAVELPVLCSNLEGPSEMICGNGLLFEPNDANDFCNKLRKILSLDRNELAQNAKRIKNSLFTYDSRLTKTEHLLRFIFA